MRWRWLALVGWWLGSTGLVVSGLVGAAVRALRARRPPYVPPRPIVPAAPVIPPVLPMTHPELTTENLVRVLEVISGEHPSAIQLAALFIRTGVRGAMNSRTTNPVCVWFSALFNLTPVSDIPEWHGGAGAQTGDLIETADGLLTVVTEGGHRVAVRLPENFREFLTRYDAGEFPALVEPSLQEAIDELGRQLRGIARTQENP